MASLDQEGWEIPDHVLAEIHREWDMEERADKRRAFCLALSGRCKDCQDYSHGAVSGILHSIKAMLCIMLGWKWKAKTDFGLDWYRAEKTEVLMFDYQTLYAGWDAKFLSVGYGWKNWWYSIDSDGDWNM